MPLTRTLQIVPSLLSTALPLDSERVEMCSQFSKPPLMVSPKSCQSKWRLFARWPQTTVASSLSVHTLLPALVLHMFICTCAHMRAPPTHTMKRSYRRHYCDRRLGTTFSMASSPASSCLNCRPHLPLLFSLAQSLPLAFMPLSSPGFPPSLWVLLPPQCLSMSLPPLPTPSLLGFLGF